MITKITSEQRALILRLYEEYLAIGLSTEPINIAEMKKVIDVWYAQIKQPTPAYLVFSSPVICSMFCCLFLNIKHSQLNSQLGSQLNSQLNSQLGSQLYSQLNSQLNSQLGSQLYSQLREQLDSQLDPQLGSQLDPQLGSQLREQLRLQLYPQLDSQLDPQLGSQLDPQLGSQLREQLRLQLYSQLNSQLGSQLNSQLREQLRLRGLFDSDYWQANLAAPWISYFKCGGLLGVKYTSEVETHLNQWDTISRHGFHWWPRVGLVVCSDRPRHVFFKNKLLHADGRKAVEFSDGWGVYSNNGVRLPEQYGEKKIADWQPEWVLKEENQEIKRVLLENIPSEKLANILALKTLDTFVTENSHYELVEAKNNPYPSPYRALRFKCPSTGRPYLVRVAPEITSAEAAITMLNKGTHPKEFVWEH